MRKYDIPFTDSVEELLTLVARRIGAVLPSGEAHKLVAATHILADFRQGKLGRFTLDDLDVSTADIDAYFHDERDTTVK